MDEARRQYMKAYYAANRERIRAQNKAWSDANKEKQKRRRSDLRVGDARLADLQRQREWREANKTDQAEKQKVWRQENRERKAATDSARRLRNRERVRVVQTAWAAANIAKVRQIKAAWRRRNPENGRLWAHKRRVAYMGGNLSRGILRRLFALQKGRCACCGCSLRKASHLDHIQPLARGGEHCDSNVQLLCPPCNQKKGAKDPFEWANHNGRLL